MVLRRSPLIETVCRKTAKRRSRELCPSYRRYNSILVRETSSALCASSLENFSAVSSSHSLSKAMLHLSLTFLRLVCSEHSIAPPYTVWKRVKFCIDNLLLLIISQKFFLVKCFFKSILHMIIKRGLIFFKKSVDNQGVVCYNIMRVKNRTEIS